MKAILSLFIVYSLVFIGTVQAKTDNTRLYTNQVMYNQTANKVAVVSSARALTDDALHFQLLDKKQVVFSGKLTADGQFNAWRQADANRYFYHADFSAFKQSGQYQLQLANGQSTTVNIAKHGLFTTTTAALLSYFKHNRNDQRYNWKQDNSIRLYGTQKYANVQGGWNDAGGDRGKYLSHLSYANFFNPQQLSFTAWALAYSYQAAPHHFADLKLDQAIIEEAFWGADYLVRTLDSDGFFYMTVYDRWGEKGAERVVTAYVGPNGQYTPHYQAAFREGGGAAIAALAQAYQLSKQTNKAGTFTAVEYLAAAKKGFAHLVKNNLSYCDDGQENIIDDYTALLAASELYKATQDQQYLTYARVRARNLIQRLHPEGWFISNHINSDNPRPYYHAAEAGFPIVALSLYLDIETDKAKAEKVKQTIVTHLQYQLTLNTSHNNPFNYPMQVFKRFEKGKLKQKLEVGFFIPQANETNYWWQGESARLSSLTTAIHLAKKHIDTLSEYDKLKRPLGLLAQNQIDWILGRNPYQITMLNGFGINNPVPYKGLEMIYGGISNGITGLRDSPKNEGIAFAPESDWQNWRWVEQWLPHSTWFLLASSTMAM